MSKKLEKTVGKTQKSLYLDDSLWDKIDLWAKKEDRSVNKLLEIVIKKEVYKQQKVKELV